jgi:hypothetical protein
VEQECKCSTTVVGFVLQLQPSSSQSATAKITFTASLSASRSVPGRSVLFALGLLPIGILLGFGLIEERHALRAGMAVLLLTTTVTMVSCGGGGGNSGTGGHGSNSYNIVVSTTAAGTGTSRTIGTVAVTVTH